MLVLTRKIEEGVKIGPDIEVRILHVKGNKVRLGIIAPNNLVILRSERPDKPPDERPEK